MGPTRSAEMAAPVADMSITTQPSALVAVRVSTGQVIAVANGPAGGGFDTALLGQIVPGSAFKIVTTTALLEQGFNVNTSVPCLPQILVLGKTFHNYEGEQLGSVPFHTDFAKSCNTAFISLSSKVAGSTLPDTAKSLGIGACWSLGTPVFPGSVALPTASSSAGKSLLLRAWLRSCSDWASLALSSARVLIVAWAWGSTASGFSTIVV